jgi:ketosteroid isomerase-like protein
LSRQNVNLVEAAYARLARQDPLGDWSWFFEEFAHDELELRPAATYLDAAPRYEGPEGWSRFWRDFSAVWEEWHWDPESFEFFDGGDEVVVFATAVGVGKGSGTETTQDEAHVWTITDGRMRLAISYLDRREAVRDAGLASRSGSTTDDDRM